MFILVDKQTNIIIDTLLSAEIEDKWIKSSHGSLIQLDMVDMVEVNSIPQSSTHYKNNKFYSTEPKIIESQHQEILSQLSQLDLIVPRILEDIISQSTYNIHQSKLDIIAQKVLLRQQLINL